MRMLVIGGTAFVGRAISLAAHEAGHDVTVLNRGVTPSDLPDGVERIVGDRQADLSALEGRTFDATFDVIAYRGRDVDALADALGDRGGHHLQISSVSAYGEPMPVGATEEQASLWPEGGVDDAADITGETYGPLKAAAERAAQRRFGEQLTIVRPTYVIGGHDLTMRFPYWVQRCRRGGTIAVPGPRDSALQYIDARDLAALCVALVEHGTTGAFTAAGPWPRASFVDTVERVAAHVAPAGTSVVEIDPAAIESAGLAGRFPLWTGTQIEPAMAVDPSKALANGLSLRPLTESVDDVVSWWGDREEPAHWLSPKDEAALLNSAA
jgi:2'-hydroxyisoflavone reductase